MILMTLKNFTPSSQGENFIVHGFETDDKQNYSHEKASNFHLFSRGKSTQNIFLA